MTEPKSVAVDFDPFAQGEIARTAQLTSPQRELWSGMQLGGQEANYAYNEASTLILRGELDEPALLRALSELAARHEALRTTFSANGSSALIASTGTLVPRKLDLSRDPDPEAAYAALGEREVSTGFDLVRGPLFRATLVRIGPSEQRLLLVAHHIVCDGWSYGVLLQELGLLYSAYTSGGEPELDPPESYAEFAAERAQQEQGSEGKASLAYWVNQYADSVPVLDLPLDHARPPLRTYASERLDRELDGPLVQALRSFAKQHSASLLQVLLTGFEILLARLSNQWDVVVGLPTAGQASSGRLGLVGHAVSYLPIRAQLDPNGSFLDALARTKTTMGNALDNQDVSFGRLLEHLPIARDPSRVPLAPISFNLEAAFLGGGFAGLDVYATSIPRTYEVFEIFANLVDRKSSIVVETQYNTDLFDAETIEDWIESYQALLAGIVRDPKQTLAQLPVLSEALATRVLEEWNDTRTAYPRETTIHGFFEQQVDDHPTRDALVFEGQRISYAELDARANRLAHNLVKRGVSPGQIVGVCVRRSLDMVCAQLGVMKAGAAYLPLDPTYPAERLQHMLSDSGARVIVTRKDSEAALGTRAQLGDRELVSFDEQRDALGAEPQGRVESAVKGSDIAYVIYTSGSTGKPKGVLVEHHNFANFLTGMQQRLTLSAPGVWLSATSIGFDISLLEIFGALGRGFTVVLHSDDSGPEFGLAQLAKQHGVTHFQCTPSQATLLLGDAAGREAIASLRELLLGGEALPLDLAKRLRELLTQGRLINMYGPTETTIWSTTHEVQELTDSVPIGKPIANTRVYILDEQGAPVARGAVGELYIGGAGVTRGYHNRPELTAERFVRDPFAKDAEARMYKTGDLARLRANGDVEFLGRNDHQVKIRGYRIELGEIEVALRAHPAVRDAAVMAREDRAGDKRLVAYLVCEAAPTVQELKAFLTHAGLPDYMLPQAFLPLPKLPTTPNGKLDRRALPAPDAGSALSVGKYVAPADDLEGSIAEGWRAVLGLARVGTEDNFFDLGGHSLLVVRLSEELSQRTGKPVAIPDLFRFPTVRSLASYLRAGASQDTGSAQRGAERRTSERRTTGRRG